MFASQSYFRILVLISLSTAWFPAVRAQFDDYSHLEQVLSPGHSENLYPGLGKWLEDEYQAAVHLLMQNLAPLGENAKDAVAGTVLASPSGGEDNQPNYRFQWTRDAAITSDTLVSLYLDEPDSELGHAIVVFMDSYVNLTQTLQRHPNPSGSFEDLKGLGEPKFQLDGSPFDGPWGRPQHDGPALRALAQIRWLRAWNSTQTGLWPPQSDEARSWFERLYKADLSASSTVKADLEYVSHFWGEAGFDLWEEIQGRHFFTWMVQLRAMHEGALLADEFDDPGAADWYRKQEGSLTNIAETFWNEERGHLVETTTNDRTGLDCGIILGALRGCSSQIPCPYQPWSAEVLATLHKFVKDQAERFPINYRVNSRGSQSQKRYRLRGVGLGRYPEDVYDGVSMQGGNPWFICTSAAAEVLFRTASHLQSQRELSISRIVLPFWLSLLPEGADLQDALEANHPYVQQVVDLGMVSDRMFKVLLDSLLSTGDSFLDVVRQHSMRNGSLSEQFDGTTGFERGARDLTWSYGALIEAVRARNEAIRTHKRSRQSFV